MENMAPMPNLLTVKMFSKRHPAFSESSLRYLIYKSRSYNFGAKHGGLSRGNGMIEAGAIVRVGRKLLLNEQGFFAWLKDRQVTHN